MPLTVILTHNVDTEVGVIPKGTECQYLGHVIGGMIQIEHDGKKHVIHPNNTKELGQESKQ